MINRQKGDAKTDFLIFLGVVFIFFVLWIASGGPAGGFRSGADRDWFGVTDFNFPAAVGSNRSAETDDRSEIGKYEPVAETVTIDGLTYYRSPWYKQVKIKRGNAAHTYQPREEYIILDTSRRNDTPINITGWILENNDSRTLHQVSGRAYRGVSERVVIPEGAGLLLGADQEYLGPIVLKPGDRAVVTTGSLFSGFPFPVKVSFRTNICTGYLNDLTSYDFNPRLRQDCPDPESELNGELLENRCYDYIERLRRCRTPDDEPFRDRDGDLVRNHLDGVTGLSRQCRDFVAEHYNYRSCVVNNAGQPDFLGDEWRIYLNQHFELWDDDREVITLYDDEGRLVDQIEY